MLHSTAPTCITTCSCRATAPSSSSSLLVKHDSWLVNSCVCRAQLLLSCAIAALSWLCCTVLLSLVAVEDQDERLASTADNLQQQQHQQQVQPMLFAFGKQSPHELVQQCWSCKHLLLTK
jgi:hypothetical protein